MKKILLISYICILPLVYTGTGQEGGDVDDVENNENNQTVKRFVIESQYSPPIFGSFKFNALTNQFDLPDGIQLSKPVGGPTALTTNTPIGQLRSLGQVGRTHNERARSDEQLARPVQKAIIKPNVANANKIVTTKTPTKTTLANKTITKPK